RGTTRASLMPPLRSAPNWHLRVAKHLARRPSSKGGRELVQVAQDLCFDGRHDHAGFASFAPWADGRGRFPLRRCRKNGGWRSCPPEGGIERDGRRRRGLPVAVDRIFVARLDELLYVRAL